MSDTHPILDYDYHDNDGYPAQVVRCPDCGQLELWTATEALSSGHGKCRASNAPCWCEEVL